MIYAVPLAVAHVTQKVGDPLAFYTVAATIIPVLFIALEFETQALAPKGATEAVAELVFGVLVVGMGIAGEASAIKVLLTQEPSQGHRAIIVAALIFIAIIMVLVPLKALMEPLAKKRGDWRETLVGVGIALALVAFGLVGAAGL